MNLERTCVRCGAPEEDEDTRSRFELEMALSEDDPERRSEACLEHFAALNHLYEVDGGLACWDCLTQQERRREQFQCERCGAQFHDDGRDSDAGWITPDFGHGPSDQFLCPGCITPEEDRADTEAFLRVAEEGKRLCAAKGEEYPTELDFAAARERARLWRRRQNLDELNQLVGEEQP
jgi:hypothetical protein